jgi:Fe2+ transport system protein B
MVEGTEQKPIENKVSNEMKITDSEMERINSEIKKQEETKFQQYKDDIKKEFTGLLQAEITKVKEQGIKETAESIEAIKKQLTDSTNKMTEMEKKLAEYIPERKGYVQNQGNPYNQATTEQIKQEYGKSKEEFAQMFGIKGLNR